MYNNNQRSSNTYKRHSQKFNGTTSQQYLNTQNCYPMYQNLQQNSNNRDVWQNHIQSQLLSKKQIGGTTVHGRNPMLMANNDVFTIGPYKSRKDSARISVLEKYEIIGYIAAGTYGKVYKAKNREITNPGSKDPVNNVNKPRTADILINSRRDPDNKIHFPTSSTVNSDVNGNIIQQQHQQQQRITRNLELNTDNHNNTNNNNNKNSSNSNRINIKTPGKPIPASGNTSSINTGDGNIKNSNMNSKNDSNSNDNITRSTSSHSNSTLENSLKKDNSNVNGNGKHVVILKPETLNGKKDQPVFYAIKKFKTEKEGVEQVHYIGISQSACREMALCRELDNKHLTKLVEIFLEKKNIYLVYEYAEHDLLQIIHYHSHPKKKLIPTKMIKSIMWQILDGVSFLHQNWIIHRDLKPANIMVTANGCVKIGDLGLARKFSNLLQTLYTGDKVVVTIWYRAPELLLGARHYTPAIDVWAIGCIFAELMGLQPIFKGEEAKMDSKKGVPFQSNQMQKILEVLGTPSSKMWKNLHKYPEYDNLAKFPKYRENLAAWYHSTGGRDSQGLDLLRRLLNYDPITRIDAIIALDHSYFTDSDSPVSENIFEGLNYHYPARRIHTEDNDIMSAGRVHKSRNVTSQSQMMSHGGTTTTLGGLGVNRRILAAAAAAAAAVSGGSLPLGSRVSEPSRKKRR